MGDEEVENEEEGIHTHAEDNARAAQRLWSEDTYMLTHILCDADMK